MTPMHFINQVWEFSVKCLYITNDKKVCLTYILRFVETLLITAIKMKVEVIMVKLYFKCISLFYRTRTPSSHCFGTTLWNAVISTVRGTVLRNACHDKNIMVEKKERMKVLSLIKLPKEKERKEIAKLSKWIRTPGILLSPSLLNTGKIEIRPKQTK